MVSVPQNRVREWSCPLMGQQNSTCLWRSRKRRHSCDMSLFMFSVLIVCLALQEFKLVSWLGREVSVRLSSFLRKVTKQRKNFGFHWFIKRFSQGWTSPRFLLCKHQPDVPELLKCQSSWSVEERLPLIKGSLCAIWRARVIAYRSPHRAQYIIYSRH